MIKDIIFCGMDRCGKTTQIQQVWTYLNSIYPSGCNIIRADKMQEGLYPNIKHHQFLYAHSINMSFSNMVNARHFNLDGIRLYDRLHLSEVVYGQKYRGYDCSNVYDLEKKIIELDNVFLITFIDEVDNLVTRDDGLGFTSDPLEILDEKTRFVDAHNDSRIKNKLLLNINNLSIDNVFSIIKKFIKD